MITFPNAKINLGLNVVEKRPDGYHNLETVFYPIKLQDALEVNRLEGSDLPYKIHTSGTVIEGNLEDNLVIKAYNLLTLIVCGTLISDCIPYHSDGQYALIPVVPMLEGLGISLDWQDDHTARFEVSGEELVLETAAGTLAYADSPNFSLLLPAPGSKHPSVITTIDGVFMVDTDTLLLFFQRNSIYCYRYDTDSTVEIGFREEATTPSA